jgi:hypothetical protein
MHHLHHTHEDQHQRMIEIAEMSPIDPTLFAYDVTIQEIQGNTTNAELSPVSMQ